MVVDRGHHPGRDLVGFAETVDLDHFDRRVAHIEAGAENAAFGDCKVVGKFRAEDNELVEARAAIDKARVKP